MSATVSVAERRRTGRPPSRPPVNLGLVDAVLDASCEPSVALIFLMMARRLPVSVKAYPHRDDPDAWCFKFVQSGVLEINGRGEARWISGTIQIRRTIDLVLDRARQRFEATAWYVPGGRGRA